MVILYCKLAIILLKTWLINNEIAGNNIKAEDILQGWITTEATKSLGGLHVGKSQRKNSTAND